MPKNTARGLLTGAFAFLFGFAMVWYIWWLAILSVLGIIFTLIARTSDDDTHYVVPAAEVVGIAEHHGHSSSLARVRAPRSTRASWPGCTKSARV